MRHLRPALALVLAAACTCAPAVAAEPPQAAVAQASAADIDRLLEVMDMRAMMDDMMEQMGKAQEAAILQAFGKDLSEKDRAGMADFMRRTQDRVRAELSWERMGPLMRKVYIQVFTKREVDAMVAFYGSVDGRSILRKSPQAMALAMQEMQPVMQALMAEVKTELDGELARRSP